MKLQVLIDVQVWVLDTWLKNTNAINKPLVYMLFYQINPPNKLYTHLSQALLFRLICNAPIKNKGLQLDQQPFSTVLTMKNIKKPA